jgi:predicted HTH transcriptional regulator
LICRPHTGLRVKSTTNTLSCVITAKVHRKSVGELTLVAEPPKTSGKTSGKNVGENPEYIKAGETFNYTELARLIGVTDRSIERNIRILQDQGLLRRIGPAKGGLLGSD